MPCWALPDSVTSAAISPTPTRVFAAPIPPCFWRRLLGACASNLDSTVIAQAPKLAPHIEAMRARIAQILAIDPSQVNVKAKTAEKMGPVGEGRSIETRAVVLLSAA